jgi:hypothetical protein
MRHLRVSGAVLAAMALLTACTPTTASVPERPRPTEDAGPGVVTSTVTRAQLGPGSTIVVVTNVRERGAPASGLVTSLEVITPDGVRHAVWSSAPTHVDGELVGDVDLADWRPELRTALLRTTGARGRDRVVAYDVTTGETHEVTLPRRAISAGLDPRGTGILMTLYGRDPLARTVAQTWAGERTRLPGTGGYPMTSVDGRTLVSPAGDLSGWAVVDLTTRRATSVVPPGSCSPIRWIDHDSVLTSCYAREGNQLRAVHLGGGSTVVGPFHPVGAGSAGIVMDSDTVRAGGTRWYLAESRRGVLTEGSARVTTRVPGTTGMVHLARTPDGQLLLARSDNTLSEPSFRADLAVLDPETRSRTVLVRLAPGQAWRSVIGATEVRPWNP